MVISSSGFSLPEGSPSLFSVDPSSLFFLFFPFSFYLHLDFQSSFFNYFFVWHLIFNPFNPLARLLHRLCGNGFRKLDPSILPLHFPPSNLGLNEGEGVSLLIYLDLHGSSQAGDEVGSASFPEIFFFGTTLFCETGHEVNITLLGPL